jgi:thiol-disulfide isomerase/thioredoxin
MKHRKHLGLVPILALIAACSSPPASPLFSANLDGIDGPDLNFSTLESNRGSVVVFLAPDCPLSRNHTLTLNTMAEDFRHDGIEFYGIVAGDWYSDEEIAAFQETYQVGFPIGVDRDHAVTDFLGARVTPEVFLVDPDANVLYEGAIDNWAGALARHRTVTTGHYLRDALTDLSEGRAVGVRSMTAVGCFIEREG